MSVLILDKDSNKSITDATGESNNKKPPTFSGTGRSQDPLQFVEDFEKVAKWNNWRSDERKKETFILCLTGHAERWAKNRITNDPAKFKAMTFEDDGESKGLLTKFKEHYITEEWYEMYTKQYEDRKQLENETPLEYYEQKRYLFQRAGEECQERSVKQQVRDIQ